MGTWTRRLGSLMAAVGLLMTPIAICAAEAMGSDMQQMECCKSGDHGCGSAVKPDDCCARAESRPDQLRASKVEPVVEVPASTMPWTHPALASTPIVPLSGRLESSSPRIDTGPPACVAFAVLLI